jgi:hypothetical protein
VGVKAVGRRKAAHRVLVAAGASRVSIGTRRTGLDLLPQLRIIGQYCKVRAKINPVSLSEGINVLF